MRAAGWVRLMKQGQEGSWGKRPTRGQARTGHSGADAIEWRAFSVLDRRGSMEQGQMRGSQDRREAQDRRRARDRLGSLRDRRAVRGFAAALTGALTGDFVADSVVGVGRWSLIAAGTVLVEQRYHLVPAQQCRVLASR